MPEPTEIAQWMMDRIEQEEELYQADAAKEIKKRFGKEFVYKDSGGNLAIARRVLDAFRKATVRTVVWVTHHGGGYWPDAHWRKRNKSDDPGRTQYMDS